MYMRKFKVRKNAHFKKLIIIIRIATCDKFRAVLLTNKRSHSNILRAHVSIFRQKYAEDPREEDVVVSYGGGEKIGYYSR